MNTDTPPVALTIAGSDSGGGAGIQADLSPSPPSASTGQRRHRPHRPEHVGVTGVHVPPVEFLLAQVEAVLDDLAVAAVKTGMLATEEVVRAVAGLAAAGRLPRLVVDPVLVSSTGAGCSTPGPSGPTPRPCSPTPWWSRPTPARPAPCSAARW